jgi:hypothetical protein
MSDLTKPKMNYRGVLNKGLIATLILLLPIGVMSQLEAQTPFEPNQTTPNPSETASLVSPETNIDYKPLKELLMAKEWRQANEKTGELMLRASGREAQGWAPPNNILQFPCWDLKTVDRLWKQYSNGRFGFSVQFPIFLETGNKPGKLLAVENYEKFGDRVGWRQDVKDNNGELVRDKKGEIRRDWIIFKENLNFTENAPVGHLPTPRQAYQITGGRLSYVNLTKRAVECGLVSDTTPTPQPVTPFNF